MLVGVGGIDSSTSEIRESMLDRNLKRLLRRAALAGSLAAAGCGTPVAPATDDVPASTPRMLTGTIIEMPEAPVAAANQPSRVDSPEFITSPAKQINSAQLTPRYRPAAPRELDTFDAGVRMTAAEATPIATTISASGPADPAESVVKPAEPVLVGPQLDRQAIAQPQAQPPQQAPRQPPQQAPQPLVHTTQMVAAMQKSDEHNRQGFALATRGACFSARAEFIQALRGISQGLDTEAGGSKFGQALAAGMRALQEAEDFVPRGARIGGEISVDVVARAHRTPVLRDLAKTEMPPSEAAELYRKYAVEQLSTATGGEAAGSLALHSLGKLYALFAQDPTNTTLDAQGKAIAFQRAALQADPKNYLAANELAVLLAQQGGYVEARTLLLQAIGISPRPSMWHNLAVVHARLGEMDLAELAHRTALSSAGGANPGNVQAMAALQTVRWVDPTTFSQLSPPPADLNPAGPGEKPPVPAPPTQDPAVQKGISRWNPWGTRQQ
jgi:tetratricopeptide (TPR) repeat protein